MDNFLEAARLFLDSGAAIQVKDASELAREAIDLLGDASRRQAVGEAALNIVERESGATQRILERLSKLLDESDFDAAHALETRSQ